MGRLTTDRNDPELTHGVDTAPAPQAGAYLVLSEEERRRGFVRPVRTSYRHVGPAGPRGKTAPLSPEEAARYPDFALFETWSDEDGSRPPGRGGSGRFWTQAELDAVGKGCGSETAMSRAIAETYARNPAFYGATYCVACSKHLPVEEFVWVEADGSVTDLRLGT